MPSPKSRPALLILATLVAVGWSSRAGAQTGSGIPDSSFRATRGLFIPGQGTAGDADATAVELNPAQLAFIKGGSAALLGDFWSAAAPLAGRGLGAFAATSLGPLGGIGLAYQGMFAGQADAGLARARQKLSLGYALGLGSRLAVGFTWGHLFGETVGGTNGLDLGFSLRPFNGLALGLVIEDINRPALAGVPLRRRWLGELLLRPLGSDRLQVGVGGERVAGEAWSRWSPHFRLSTRLTRGLSLFGQLDLFRRDPNEPVAAHGFDTRGTLGLAIDLDHATVVGAGVLGHRPAGAAPGSSPETEAGGSVLLRVQSERNARSLISWGRMAKVTLDGLDDERAFIAASRQLWVLASDPQISGVLIKLWNVDLGLARVEELRDLFKRIRSQGKVVYVYARELSTRGLYLASAADRVLLHPAGAVEFTGLAQQGIFLKGTLDRLGVQAEVIRIAEYKGAAETLSESAFTGPVRQNRNDLLDDQFAHLRGGVATDRSRVGSLEQVDALIGRGIFSASDALAARLVDELVDDEGLEESLRKTTGQRGLVLEDPDESPWSTGRWYGRRIAVVLVEGAIVDGQTRRSLFGGTVSAGADTVVETLERCRTSHQIAGVVLRVNSPGGSALASDRIARAVRAVRAAGKPVVVSMGDMAASGGYYVSAFGDTVFAEPSTITGSIGVIGLKMDAAGLAARLGITVETLKRGSMADAWTPFRPWTATERETIQGQMRSVYASFLQTVVEGRRQRGLVDQAHVDAIGRGRIWTGAQAQGIGLVDRMGGIMAAIEQADHLAGLPRTPQGVPELVVLPAGGLSEFLRALSGQADTAAALIDGGAPRPLLPRLPADLRGPLRLLEPYLFGSVQGIQARLPFELVDSDTGFRSGR